MEEKQSKLNEEINLLDYVIVLLKRKTLIMIVTAACAVLAGVVSLILPEIYKAQTRILPPQQGSSLASQLLSQFAGGLSGLAGGILGAGSSTDLYSSMLRSRTVMDKIIDRFGLMKSYGVKFREDAREKLNERVAVEADSKSSIIIVSVEDRDPQKAADMANALVEELRNLTKGLAVSEASHRRLFFEEQLKKAKEALASAEESMRGFQEKTGALQMEEQAKAVIEGIANLRAQLAVKEVEISVMRTYTTKNNPDLQKAEEALRGLRAELSKLESKGSGSYDPLMPTGRMPSVGTEYMRKIRELKYNEALYELFAKQYELAKVDEAKDAMVIQIIDKAMPPEKRAKPKRTLIVLVATATGFFFAVFAAFFVEYIQSPYPDHRERIQNIKKHMKFRLKAK